MAARKAVRPRPARRPADPALVTPAAYGRHRGISRQGVHQAIVEERISVVTVAGRKMIDPRVADREWRERTDTTKPRNSVTGNPSGRTEEGGVGAGDRVTFHRANTARAAWNAKLAKLEYLERSGKVVPVEVVAAAIYSQNRKARSKLRELPISLERMLENKPGAEIRRILAAAIDRVCLELSDPETNETPAAPANEDLEPEAHA